MKRRDGHIGGMLFIEGLVQTFCKLILRGWKDGPWRTELLGGPKLKGGISDHSSYHEHVFLKKQKEETQIEYQNTIFISSKCYYPLTKMTSKRKVKITSYIQQNTKTKQLNTKNSTPTPNSLIPSSTATNKQNGMSADTLLEKQQKS